VQARPDTGVELEGTPLSAMLYAFGAERARIELLSRLQRGEHVAPSKLTIAEYLTERWLPAIKTRVRPTTHASYSRNVRRHLGPTIGHVRLRNVADRADPRRQDRSREAMQTWTAGRVGVFLRHVRDDRIYALWLLLATTGLRRGEAVGLGWEDADLDAARIAVRRNLTAVSGAGKRRSASWSEPKTAKSRRSVALDPATVTALREHRRRQLTERVAWGSAWHEHGSFNPSPTATSRICRSIAAIAVDRCTDSRRDGAGRMRRESWGAGGSATVSR
jgi:integrase